MATKYPQYNYGTGRRKTSAARVFLRPGTGTITVNPNPVVTVNSTAVCLGNSGQLCATVNTNTVGPVTYSWNTGETTQCITKTPSVTTTSRNMPASM